MNDKQKANRVLGTIRLAECKRDYDYDVLTGTVHLDLETGHQGFQMCLDDEWGPAWTEGVCRLFGAGALEKLVGLRCYALYSFGKYSQSIEGLENMDGERFTRTGFVRQLHPGVIVRTPLDRRRDSLVSDIRGAQRDLAEAFERLLKVEAEYCDWEAP